MRHFRDADELWAERSGASRTEESACEIVSWGSSDFDPDYAVALKGTVQRTDWDDALDLEPLVEPMPEQREAFAAWLATMDLAKLGEGRWLLLAEYG